MRRSLFRVGLPLAIVLSVAAAEPPASASREAEQPVVVPQELPRILDTMTRVAALYADAAMGFTCQEHISASRYLSQDRVGARNTFRLDYFYIFNEDPDLGDLGLQDYRTYRPSGEAVEPVRVNPADLGVPAYLERAYSWVFLFQPNLRGNLGFRLEPDSEALGRPAFVIRFAPTVPPREDPVGWTGRMWIDRETFQLLRVEAVQSTHYRSSPLPTGEGESEFVFTRAEVEFGYEKNGLRFPTEAVVIGAEVALEAPFDASYEATSARLLDRGMPYGKLFRVQQRYQDYRFFSVRTADDVTSRILGSQND